MGLMKLDELNRSIGKFGRPFPHNRGIDTIAHELKVNPPKVLAKTKQKYGAKRAEKQRVAILLSKARQRGIKT